MCVLVCVPSRVKLWSDRCRIWGFARVQSEKISKMKAGGAEFHDVKQQEEVLKESEACVIDSKRRLDGVLQDLEAMVEEHGEALGDNEDLKAVKELLAANPPPEN